tara:strand:- start:289 stop:597 length:309 start_codon:yes stop_codon:yes gene_type:complete
MAIKKGGRKSLYGKTKNITKPKRLPKGKPNQMTPSPKPLPPKPQPLPPKPQSIPKDHPKRIQKNKLNPGKWRRVIKRVTGEKDTPGGSRDFRIGGSKYTAGK